MEKPRFSRVWKLQYMSAIRSPPILLLDALFLCSFDVHEHSIEAEHTLLQGARVLGYLARLRRRLSPGLALHHDVKVDEFLGERRHVVFEAEGVLSDGVCGEDVVSLALALAVEDDLVVRVLDVKVYVERAPRLHLHNTRKVGMEQRTRGSTYCKIKLHSGVSG